MEVHVNAGDFPEAPVLELRSAVRHTLEHEGFDMAEMSVTLLDDAGISALNRQYLDREGPTDVIAFSLGEPLEPLGDIYIGYQQAERQCIEHGVPLREELSRLAIHGTLHVLGHDHPEGEGRIGSPMFQLQERLLAVLLDRFGDS